MGEEEKRFREGLGQRYMVNGKVRCHGCSKTKLKLLRAERNDPTLEAADLWPEAQCSQPAVEGTFGCSFHGGKSKNANKKAISDWLPYDLKEKLSILESNKDALFNRDNEIAQLLSRNAQLYESLDDLVLGEEAYQTVAEAKKALIAADVGTALRLLDIALKDVRTEKEVMIEVRENIKLLNTLTLNQFTIREKLRVLATMDQVKNLIDGIYRGFEKVVSIYIPDDKVRSKAVYEFADMIRNMANARHTAELGATNDR